MTADGFCFAGGTSGGNAGASTSQTSQSNGSLYEQRLTQLMARVSDAVERNESRLEEQERREAIALEWKQVSLVCDR